MTYPFFQDFIDNKRTLPLTTKSRNSALFQQHSQLSPVSFQNHPLNKVHFPIYTPFPLTGLPLTGLPLTGLLINRTDGGSPLSRQFS